MVNGTQLCINSPQSWWEGFQLNDSRAFCPFSSIYWTTFCFLVLKFQFIQEQVRKGKNSEKKNSFYFCTFPMSLDKKKKVAALNPVKFLGYLWILIIYYPAKFTKGQLLGMFISFQKCIKG